MPPFLRRFLAGLFLFSGVVAIVLGWFFAGKTHSLSPFVFPLMRQTCVVLLGFGALAILFTRLDKRLVWEGVFLGACLAGSFFGFLAFFPLKIGIFFSAVLPCGVVLLRNVLFQNLAFFWGSLGFSLFLAGWLPSEVLLTLLVAFSAYDMLAAHPDGPIVAIARHTAGLGQVPGFIIPPTAAGFFQSTERLALRAPDLVSGADGVSPAEEDLLDQAALLGPADLVFVLAVLIRATFVDVRMGVACWLGLLAGCLFLLRGGAHPRTLLPAFAAGVGLPFAFFLIIGYFA